MNQEISENKISFLASRISGFNSFLFWFGKKVYSFLLGLIFIIFVGAGVYTVFAGGDSVSVPDFGDQKDKAEVFKEIEEEKAKREKEIEEEKAKREKDYKAELDKRLEKRSEAWKTMSEGEAEGEFHAIKEEVWEQFYGKENGEENGEENDEKEDTRDYRKRNIDDKYGDDIKHLLIASEFNSGVIEVSDSNYNLYVKKLLAIPEDQRDSYFYGLVDYMEESYEYYSKDDNFEMFRRDYEWKTKWDIHNWGETKYTADFFAELEKIERSEASAAATRILSLQVMGGSFLAFLIAVLIVIFIQIEANTRPDNKDRT